MSIKSFLTALCDHETNFVSRGLCGPELPLQASNRNPLTRCISAKAGPHLSAKPTSFVPRKGRLCRDGRSWRKTLKAGAPGRQEGCRLEGNRHRHFTKKKNLREQHKPSPDVSFGNVVSYVTSGRWGVLYHPDSSMQLKAPHRPQHWELRAVSSRATTRGQRLTLSRSWN